ncbi:MAG: hypothetical protein LBR34_03485 [Prevotella sp.]|nr:hypothetical protein [Prevotella sp.]
MIQSIIGVFEEQAQQHRLIQSFHYHRNYDLGNGHEAHPLFWLEDPLYGHIRNNIFVNSANFSVLFIPNEAEQVAELQNLAFAVGLNILERIRQDRESPVGLLPDWNYMLLRDYYDNNACGCRFSVEITCRNIQNRCLLDAQFDSDKTFENFRLSADSGLNAAVGLSDFVLHHTGV